MSMLRRSLPLSPHAVTYYTVSNHRFFLGTAALINSLHVTGNDGEVVVLDAGLTQSERDLLSAHATVFTPPRTIDVHPVLMKAFGYLSQPSGLVVVIDSDMIVTGSFDHILALACKGKICAYPDVPALQTRWFSEWETTLQLRSPLRPDIYVNSGLVAFSTLHWPRLFERWWEVCALIPLHEMWGSQSPFNSPDQDALNALLMSEIPREAVALLPESEETFGGHATVEDFDTLTCTADGRPTKILHLLDSPKPWEHSGWLRLAATDYVRLMRRLLFATDVLLRLHPDHVPLWLRPSRRGELTLRTLGAANRSLVGAAYMVPDPLRDRLRRLRRWVADGKSHPMQASSDVGRACRRLRPPHGRAPHGSRRGLDKRSTKTTQSVVDSSNSRNRIAFERNDGRERSATLMAREDVPKADASS
jgi:hypothetical protein